MKKFIVLFKQGGGCDYTIGCGLNWKFIKAKSKEEAAKFAVKKWGHDFEAGHEHSFHEFDLYEVTDHVDLGKLAKAANEEQERKERELHQQRVEARERALLKDLQSKYGKQS